MGGQQELEQNSGVSSLSLWASGLASGFMVRWGLAGPAAATLWTEVTTQRDPDRWSPGRCPGMGSAFPLGVQVPPCV